MSYSISEVAEMMGVSVYTLRFYDKEGLLPNVKRVNGRRVFEDSDFGWLRVLDCMKNTGMPLKDIRQYLNLAAEGDATLQARYDMIMAHKRELEAHIASLQAHMKELDYKVWYYETALKAGTEAVHKGNTCTPGFEPDEIPDIKPEE